MFSLKYSIGEILIGTIILVFSLWFLMEALALPISRGGNDVGPATFPLIASGLCTAFSLIFIVQALVARKKDNEKKIIVNGPKKVILSITAFLLYIALIPIISFYVSTLVFLPLLLLITKERNWIKIGLITAGFLLFSFVGFELILGVPLP
ncbi:tripartite tricarboxylate transporter TctB family protein [Shouchella shacheensis]|uniref:tripartite tricarboxylate transporter TctB family protein n=1 Tax=Shouchella shacheensis TaxID=1649580 RepID=UPI00073FD209|nr:tripartite tricarboxylate transporter TctB family protein [Shouchella shacheensis]